MIMYTVHVREAHATLINTIPLKIATLLNLQSLKLAYSFRSDVLIVYATSRHYSVMKLQVTPDVSQLLRWVAVDMIHIHHSSDHTNGRILATAHRSALCKPVIKFNYFLFTTFIHAKLGISPPTRCLRCAADGSA